MWMEALQQFSKIESLSINVQSGLNFFYLFRFLSENKLVFNWLKTIRRLEVLDVAPKADPDLAIIDSLILNIQKLEHLVYYLNNPSSSLEKLPEGHFQKFTGSLPAYGADSMMVQLRRIQPTAIELIGARNDNMLIEVLPKDLKELRIRNMNLPA
jgi:hypothetical protein